VKRASSPGMPALPSSADVEMSASPEE
jgi:hypothetical protein